MSTKNEKPKDISPASSPPKAGVTHSVGSMRPKSGRGLPLNLLLRELNRIYEKPLEKRDWLIENEEVTTLMAAVEFDLETFAPHMHLHDKVYTRNLIASKDYIFDLMVIAWNVGQKAPIHDHANSSCWMRVLDGHLEEKRWGVDERGKPRLCLTRQFKNGDVFYINNEQGLHSVYNIGTKPAFTLHLYTPPITTCRAWLCDGITFSKCFYHTVKGTRVPQHLFYIPQETKKELESTPDIPTHSMLYEKALKENWVQEQISASRNRPCPEAIARRGRPVPNEKNKENSSALQKRKQTEEGKDNQADPDDEAYPFKRCCN